MRREKIEAIIKMLEVCRDEDLIQLEKLLTNVVTKSMKTIRRYKVRYNEIDLISVEYVK